MAVRDVMSDLAHSPALGAVGRIELLLREAFHRGAQVTWRLPDVVEQFLSPFRCGWTVVFKLADGIAQVGHCFLDVKSVVSRMIDKTRKVQESSVTGQGVGRMHSRRRSAFPCGV